MLRHRIETNIPLNPPNREVGNCLDCVRRRVGEIDFIDGIETDDLAECLVLIVKGDGQFLRSVTYALDVFGALD